MTIRRAKESDISKLIDLLEQVLLVHHKVRPDLFQEKGVKYTEAQLAELIADDNRPIFVYEDEEGEVLGHMFTIIEHSSAPKVPQKTLFIDDLCVDEAARGQKIGEQLYQFALQYAKEIGCYNENVLVNYIIMGIVVKFLILIRYLKSTAKCINLCYN